MSEFGPKFCDDGLYLAELAKARNEGERRAFEYYFERTKLENVDVLPYCGFSEFTDGVAEFNRLPIEFIDTFIDSTDLILNYSKENTERNGLTGTVEPVLDALKGDFIQSVHEYLEKGSVRVIGNHPTLASPLVFARSIGAAYQAEYGRDIRSNIYIVYGTYPLTMQYSMQVPSSSESIMVPPLLIGRTLGNVFSTAAKTDNTVTEDPILETHNNTMRQNCKNNNINVLSKVPKGSYDIGNLLIVLPSGRRGKIIGMEDGCRIHKEYLPEGRCSYITKIDVPTFLIGIHDSILVNKLDPRSIARVVGDPIPRIIKNKSQLEFAMEHIANFISTDTDEYRLENNIERLKRLGKKIIRIGNEYIPTSE